MIHVQHLWKQFGGIQAVSDISFSIPTGKLVGLLGRNGAGKTTTIRMLTGVLKPDSGMVTLSKHDTDERALAKPVKIGYLPEKPPVYPELRVQEYLRFLAEVKAVEPSQCTAEIERVMEMTHVTDVRRRLIGKLSKGYCQRVGLAQAMLGDPDILILDEPTVGLDPLQITQVRKMIKKLAGNKTVLLSTHILQEVTAICDQVIIINKGKIVSDASIAELVEQDGSLQGRSLEEVFVELADGGVP